MKLARIVTSAVALLVVWPAAMAGAYAGLLKDRLTAWQSGRHG